MMQQSVLITVAAVAKVCLATVAAVLTLQAVTASSSSSSATLRSRNNETVANVSIRVQQQRQSHQQQQRRDQNDDEQERDLVQAKIIGGSTASPGEFPYFVEWVGCGATLIHPDIILSAAHCSGTKSNGVLVGAYKSFADFGSQQGAQFRTITTRVVHPNFSTSTGRFDFMIMQLDRPVYSQFITPVVLNREDDIPNVDDPLTTIGFGKTSTSAGATTSTTLNKVTVNYIDEDVCKSNYGSNNIDDNSMFCAGVSVGGKDSCQGDSGSPILTAAGVQVGVTSLGVGCGLAQKPGIYARVSAATNWIDDQICALSAVPPSSCRGGGPRPPTPAPIPVPAPSPSTIALRLDVMYDLYPSETSWTILNQSGQRLVNSTSGTSNAVRRTYFQLPPGNYILQFADSIGDGFCCSSGVGYYGLYAVVNGAYVSLREGSGYFLSRLDVNFVVPGSTAPAAAPSLAPVVSTPRDSSSPTRLPIAPTRAPIFPTLAPVLPTQTPVSPTAAPVRPTQAPVLPTRAPVLPTLAPVLPTPAPVFPTPAPVQPTPAPVRSTRAPVRRPTKAPVRPTPTPVRPTRPTRAPSKRPTLASSLRPTLAPSLRPTSAPSLRPTLTPSIRPTSTPSILPTPAPVSPTAAPVLPTANPVKPLTRTTRKPRRVLTPLPTIAPTPLPTTEFPSLRPTTPTSSPSTNTIVSPILCADSPTVTFLYTGLYRGMYVTNYTANCAWLRLRSSSIIESMCKPGSVAYQGCSKTCGICVDRCRGQDDTRATFPVDGRLRNCQWLNLRPNLWPTQCAAGQPANTVCKEVCGTC